MINSGFIYKWTDSATGLAYIGKHEGALNDGYVGSGTIFIKEYQSRPNDFTRQILWFGENITSSELTLQEETYLLSISDDELYYGKNRKYYNQVRNSSGYTSENNPMKNPEVVERMKATRERLGLKNPWENTVSKNGYQAACDINSRKMIGNKNGEGNKNKPKSEQHKLNLAKSARQTARQNPSTNGGRKPAMPFEETLEIYKQYGIRKGAEYLNIGYDAFKSRVILAKKKLTSTTE